MLLPAALALAPAESILVVDNLVVGSRKGGRWTETDLGFAKRHKATGFRAFGVGKVAKGVDFYGFGQDQPDGPTFIASEDASSEMSPMVSGVVPKVPRAVRSLPASATYEGIARAALGRKGVKVAKARITGLYRVDLDGDGTQEVLIEATDGRKGDEGWSKGAYSIVLLRTWKGTSTALESATAPQGGVMDAKRLRGIADLDGDGRMEVLTTGNAEEFNKATLWGYRRGVATKLLEGAAAY